jgi:dihydroneopterin triphosphate diphosphatase
MDIRQEIPIKSFSIAAYICKVEGNRGKYLVIRRMPGYLGDTWQMISGKVEAGETGWQAALREIEEETGLIPDRFYSADTLEMFYEVSQNCINLVPVFVGIIDGERAIRLSGEHSEYQWITVEEANGYLPFQHQKDTLRMIEACFVKGEPNPFLEIQFR